MRATARVALLAWFVLAGCAGLQPLPRVSATCASVADAAALWRCVGEPDLAPKEGGVRSTLRMAAGDLTRRVVLNQMPSLACNTKAWRGFEHVSRAVEGAARLEAFVHDGDRAKPVVFVVHGLYDSNSNRYVRFVASALADAGFGVVAPDMRWHGCLYALPSTLGLRERADLLAWARAIRGGLLPSLGTRPLGIMGFSLGALDTIDAMSADATANVFDAGAIAVSPPAGLADVAARLDRLRTPIALYFRTTLRIRNRQVGLPFFARQPFRTYLEYSARLQQFPNVAALLAAGDPANHLAEVRRPLLVIASRNDPVLGAGAADAIAAASASPYVHVLTLDEGGHIGVVGRDPQWFVNAIVNFFANAPRVP